MSVTHPTMCTVADASQAQRIREATDKSLMARDLYAERVVVGLTESLKTAETQVQTALAKYRSVGSLPENKLAALRGLERLEAEIAEAMKTLRKEQTLMFRKASDGSFRSGIYRGIEELAAAKMPAYRELTPQGMDKLSTSVFTLLDTDALDFMANYNLVLAGDVHRELSDGIKRTILSGIATGKGVDDIVRDLGGVIGDKESFRHAGGKVFTKAQYRMEMIARTEVMRAHNQGRIKFHQEVGVRRLEWMTMADERTCPECGPLDGKVFDIDKLPNQPLHPNCRCTTVVAWPLVICGGVLGAEAASGTQECILPPQAIENLAQQKLEEDKKLKAAFESGEVGDLNDLTAKQLQTLAKEHGVSVARTKADFIKLLDAAEPGIDHSDLSGAALQAKIKQYGIGALRSKDDLVVLLAEKQAAIKQAQMIAEQAKLIPQSGGLNDLTVVQLKEMAKREGVSLNLTKSEVIQMLDGLEPGVDHSHLSGKSLLAAKEKYGIPPLKNKEQLAHALEKVAGEKMADQVKLQALEEAKQKSLKAAEEKLKAATEKVVIPAAPSDYQDFLESLKAAESELAKDSGLPGSVLDLHSKDLAIKKHAFQSAIGGLKAGEIKDIAKEAKILHWQWASKDELATLISETDPAKIAAAQASIDAKYAKWAEKHGSKKGKAKTGETQETPEKTPAKPKKPQEAPAQPAPEEHKATPKKGSEFEAVDAVWARKGKPENFKYAGKADVGGAHDKEFWLDENGDKWMFKPVSRPDAFIAHGEEAAYKIGRLVDPDAIEVRTITLNGRVGSIQKWRIDLDPQHDFSFLNVADLSRSEVEQIQREHVVDWLIANHDGHSKQFLRGKDGKVYGIDKGQLFKHLGDDKLHTEYHPNGRFGEKEPLYNILFRDVKSGKVTVDPSATLRYIREIEKVSDDDYLAMIRPYAEGRFGSDDAKKKAFYDLALGRKHSLRRDFEGYYADVLNQKGFAFDEKPTTRFGKAEEELIEEVQTLGWQGKALPLDEEDIEDQNALVFVERTRDGERTVVKMKVRPEAEGRMLAKLQQAERQDVRPKIGDSLAEDKFSADILAAVKTANHHAGDGQYNQSTLEKARKHESQLKKLSKSDDPEVRAMAKSYLKWLGDVESATTDRRSIPDMFEAYLRKQEAPMPKREDLGFTIRKTKVLMDKRAISKGDLSVVSQSANTSSFFKRPMPEGEQYTIDFGDGINAVYRPWTENNLYAHSGELEIIIPERPNMKSLDKALQHMETLGLNANIAGKDDMEMLYLHKQAYVTKTDRDPEYRRLISSLDGRNASKTERVQEMRGFWEKRLGVKDITRMPGYDPIGEYQTGFKKPSAKAGFRSQYRFDISEEQIEREMKGYTLYHSLTNDSAPSTFLDSVLVDNGAMVSTVEKLRVGIPPGGMSPEEDMRSGGAAYVFMRIRKEPSSPERKDAGLYFKKNLLRRMDAISYDHDAYGRVKDDYVPSHRGTGPSDWKAFAQRTNNETILKNSVTMLDNIDAIVTSSDTERRKVLAVFKKHGITTLPDGRSVEDIVIRRQR